MKQLTTLFSIALSSICIGQQTVGLFLNTEESYDGYTIFPGFAKTYLVDNCGELINSWDNGNEHKHSSYFLEDGTLARLAKDIEFLDWNSNTIWTYGAGQNEYGCHHDFALMPNGNVLMIVSDKIDEADAIAAGSIYSGNDVSSEMIVEIEPDLINGGGNLVWMWRAWDHIIQDQDPSKPNYGVIADNPGKLDLNFVSNVGNSWLHVNGIDYNASLDQIALSIRGFNELWIIDHSTTTQQATGNIGGNAGMGGQIIYRWGNPEAYGRGSNSDKIFGKQHDIKWIPDDFNEGGKMTVFNNSYSGGGSAVHVFNPSLDGYNYKFVEDDPDEKYAPEEVDWTYSTQQGQTNFSSTNISGAHRLKNGNTLICEGRTGRIFEVTQELDIVWEYVNPVLDGVVLSQGDPIPDHYTFRARRYARDFVGFQGKNMTPQGPIESGSNYSCDINDCNVNSTFKYEQYEYEQYHPDGAHVELHAGSTAGTFSGSAGIDINPNTGEINLNTTPLGRYTITNTVPSGNGPNACISVSTISVDIVTETSVYVPEKTGNNINVYPIPSQESLNIELNMPGSEESATIQILNLQGQLIQSEQMTNKSTHMLDVSHLTPGIYLLSFYSDNHTQTISIIITG